MLKATISKLLLERLVEIEDDPELFHNVVVNALSDLQHVAGELLKLAESEADFAGDYMLAYEDPDATRVRSRLAEAIEVIFDWAEMIDHSYNPASVPDTTPELTAKWTRDKVRAHTEAMLRSN